MSKQKPRIYLENTPTVERLVPPLAVAIGLNESIMLLQIDFWIGQTDHFIDEKHWTYQSVRDMQTKAFPYWSIATINRTVASLQGQGLIHTANYNKRKGDKTRWFALNLEGLADLCKRVPSISVIHGLFQNETPSFQNETPTYQNETTLPEITTETTTERKDKEIPAPIVADTPPTPEPTIVEANTPALPIGEGKILAFPSAIETTEDTPPRAEFHAVTAAALGITGAAYPIIEKWVNFLTGNTPEYTTPRGKKKQTYNGKFYELQVTPGMSIDEIGAFGRWYRATHPGKTPYTTCEGLNVDAAKFRAAKDHDRYVERFYHDRTDVIIVDDSALPKAAGAEGDAIPISADKRAEAERIMAELLAKMNGNGVKRDSTNRQ